MCTQKKEGTHTPKERVKEERAAPKKEGAVAHKKEESNQIKSE